jgi:hypothetical protein
LWQTFEKEGPVLQGRSGGEADKGCLGEGKAQGLLGIDPASATRVIVAARDDAPVGGLTHTFYKYPARFSPKFARAVIKALTQHGDTVLDPFMGGGTTLVEAASLGRIAVGSDISSLATFIAEVKTSFYGDGELALIRAWADEAASCINIHKFPIYDADWDEAGYLRHLGAVGTWRLGKAIQQARLAANRLPSAQLQDFARCVVLRTAQWALDARKRLPTVPEFRSRLAENAAEMAKGAAAYRRSVAAASARRHGVKPVCLNMPAGELTLAATRRSRPRLILTSPPYPGVHVLYHRWQVDGRKETPAPFWIAGKLDGAGSKYYTMGDRKETDLRSYFYNLLSSFRAVRKLCDTSTVLVQLVAFSEPRQQFRRYLETMSLAGFREVRLAEVPGSRDGRLRREVPNRRWHADQMGNTPSSEEVVLFHAPAPLRRLRQHSETDAPRPHRARLRSLSLAG